MTSEMNVLGTGTQNLGKRPLLVFVGFTVFYSLFFSPIIFTGREFLSDGQLGSFYSRLTLWSDELAGGWPAAADLTQMMFHPLRHVFRHFAHGFNLFILVSFALMSTFMCGYVQALTRSYYAGTVAGLVMGLSGFMMAHLGHTGMVSGAAWTPLLLWSLEKLRARRNPVWLGLGALAIFMMQLGGHPQLTVYSYALGAGYALWCGIGSASKWQYWFSALAVFLIGVGLAAFQWIPTYELGNQTSRHALTFAEYTAFSLPIRQVFMLVFPFLFGSQYGLFFGDHYFGEWSYTELSGFTGVVALALAAVAVVARNDRVTWYWGVVAVLAVALALGGSLPWLAHVAFGIPVLNRFRAPSRHIYEYVFAIAVLAGLGTAALQRAALSSARLRRLTLTMTSLFAILTVASVMTVSDSVPAAVARGAQHVTMVKLSPAVYSGVLWMALSIGLLLWHARGTPRSKSGPAILTTIMLEMASFGRYHEWSVSGFGPPPLWHEETLGELNERIQPQQKLVNLQRGAFQLDRGRMAGLNSLNWYGPLLLERYSAVTGIDTAGQLDPSSLADGHVGLDIFAARYLFVDDTKVTRQLGGILVGREPLGIDLGSGCGLKKPALDRRITLPVPVAASQLAIVTQLNCAASFRDGDPVAEVTLRGADGRSAARAVRAGVEAAEFAGDCHEVKGAMQHKQAAIFESTPLVRPNLPACAGNTYLGQFSFDTMNIAAVEIRILERPNVRMNVLHLTLTDGRTGDSHAVGATDEPLASARWRLVKSADGVAAFENTRALPGAWLAFETIPVSAGQALATIRTSVLPDGRRFNPVRQALVETDLQFNSDSTRGVATVVRHDDTQSTVETEADAQSLLVIARNFYPGWQATVDGKPAELHRVNYAGQGVVVPAGRHTTVLLFRPATFEAGLAVAALSATMLAVLCWWWRSRPMAVEARGTPRVANQ